MRQAYSNQYGYGPQDSQGAAPNSDNLRLANLKRAVESIEQRMSSGANHPVYPRHSNRSFDSQNHITAQNAQTDELAIMQQHIARLSNQIENSQSAMAGSGLAVADIAQRQRSLSQRPVQSAVQAPQHFQTQPHVQQQSAPPPAPSASASERDRPQRSIPPNQATHNAGLDQRNMKLLVRQLAELKKELGSVKQHVSKPVTIQPKVAQSDIDRIAVAISEMKNQSNYDGEAFEKLNAELKDLRASLGRDLQQTAESNRESVTSAVNGAISEAVNGSINEVVSDAVETIMDQKQSEMSTRLDALARGFDNVILQSSNQRIPQIESLTAQLDSMRLSLEDLPQSLAISRIDDRLADLSSRIESLQTISAHDSHPHEGLNDGQIESIEGRLDEISRALVAVSNMGSKPPVVDLSSVERLEARMADLGRTVDTIAELSSISSPPVEFDDLAVRIDGLTQRLASFEKYAESGDLGGANAIFAAPDIGVIEQQLQALSEQVGEASQPTDLSHLEQHLQQLTERFDAVASDNSNAAQLSNLEAQIGQMTRAMSQQSGASVDFGPMEARLGQIEEHVLAHQASTIEAAQHAAQQAVAMLGPQDDTTQFLAALSQDLQALQQATESVSEHAGQSNTVIHDTLLQIVDRLGFIEDNITLLPEAPIGAPEVDEIESGSAAYSLTEMVEQSEQGAIQQAAVESGFIDPLPDADHVRMPVEAPSLDPVRDLESMSNSEASEDNQPLEPGSQAPNLDQLVAEASYQLKAGADAPSQNPTAGSELLQPVDAPAEIQITGDDARPDAVAAARRALQATTAEMNESAPEVTSAPEATERKRLSAGLLSKLDLSVLRKPVVMAAAAVLLVAAVAWKGYQVLYTGTQVPVAQIETNVTPEPEATSVEPGLVENSEITEETLNTSEQAVRTIDNSESMTKSALAQTTEKTVSSPTEAAEVALSQPQPSTEVQAVGLSSTPPVEPINSAIVDPIPVTPSPKFDVPTDIGPQALISAVEQGEA